MRSGPRERRQAVATPLFHSAVKAVRLRKKTLEAINLKTGEYAAQKKSKLESVEVSKAGDELSANESFGSVESVKAVSELFTPVSGVVTEQNASLQDDPEKVNKDPYGEGWMIRVKMSSSGEVDSLLTAAEYEDFTKEETE